ncbi:PAN-like domain protein [Medicago truncatula]|uniref:PAN-like domain protein n=1 Tax=Medicago truncatula TaxID=3880 RepID=A0A072UF01_MEDTR|nr:PAN-like domain protein [Medicago truncatula]
MEQLLNCTQADRFQKLTTVKSPMLLQFWTNSSMRLEECEVECLKDCFCNTYANSLINGGSHGCMLWFGDLIDIRLLISEDSEVTSQEELCDVAKKYFDELFRPNDGVHKPVLELIHSRVTLEYNQSLIPITKKGLKQDLFQMHQDKSLGPDSFNPTFFLMFLVSLLKCCLDKCISHEEYAFVEAIEVIHASKRVEWRCKGGVAWRIGDGSNVRIMMDSLLRGDKGKWLQSHQNQDLWTYPEKKDQGKVGLSVTLMLPSLQLFLAQTNWKSARCQQSKGKQKRFLKQFKWPSTRGSRE